MNKTCQGRKKNGNVIRLERQVFTILLESRKEIYICNRRETRWGEIVFWHLVITQIFSEWE